MQHVARHRFLRSTHIAKLLPHRPPKKLIERIGALYHAGYLDRPRAQLDYYDRAGSAPLVYEIGRRGRPLVGDVPRSTGARRPYIEHELAIADVMVALEIASRGRSDIELLEEDHLLALRSHSSDRRWQLSARLRISGKLVSLSVAPDAVFGVRFKRSDRTAFFLVEVDRAKMPISRADLSQSSYRRKLLTYQVALRSRQHETRFGFENARVLTVTTSEERAKSMLDVVREITRGAEGGRFLFTDIQSLLHANPLKILWDGVERRVRIDAPPRGR